LTKELLKPSSASLSIAFLYSALSDYSTFSYSPSLTKNTDLTY
jgi:hypothetical protein